MPSPNARTNPVGDTIRQRLSELQKTQEWLAEQVGVSKNAVSKWLRSGEISRSNAISVAQTLSISVGELIGSAALNASEPSSAYITGMRAPPKIEPLMEVACQLNDENLRRLFHYAVGLLREQPPAAD